MKCFADGASKVMIKLEIQEGREATHSEDFQVPSEKNVAHQSLHSQELHHSGEVYQYHTAVTLRQVRDFFHKNYVVVADSWFSSVATVLALGLVNIFFVGVI